MRAYIIRVLVAGDQFINVLIGGRDDETISSRAGRLRKAHPWSWGLLARALDRIQSFHTSMAIDDDLARGENVTAMEQAAGEIEAARVDQEIRVSLNLGRQHDPKV